MRVLIPVLILMVGILLPILVIKSHAGAEPPAAKPKGISTNDITRSPGKIMYSKSAHDISPLSPARVEELAKKLTDEERRIILKKGTEAPFCGTLLDNKKEGTYVCRLCGLPLFSSDSKFNSGTGWPSYFKPVDPDHINYIHDNSHGMVRTEITCMRCDAHLGHVFDDAPQTPTGLRFCLNSASLSFVEKGTPFAPESRPVKTETAYFAGGCFWGVEDRFAQLPGVIDAVSGYMGGRTQSPTYKQVCYDQTGHAETVKVVFDPARISYAKLMERFFKFHDPTQLNRQGPDVGDQYRSAIFTADQAQADAARKFIDEQAKSERFKGRTIATQLVAVKDSGPFYEAEEYHQDYHKKHGGSCALPPE